jgi:hypothetical protein
MKDLMDTLIPLVGEVTAKLVSDEMGKLAKGAEDPLNKAILTMMTTAMKEEGAEGITSVIRAVTALADDGDQADITAIIETSGLEAASDILFLLQHGEADRKSAVNDALTKIGKSLGVVTSALVSGLLLK